jgi:hypothetical protein
MLRCQIDSRGADVCNDRERFRGDDGKSVLYRNGLAELTYSGLRPWIAMSFVWRTIIAAPLSG